MGRFHQVVLVMRSSEKQYRHSAACAAGVQAHQAVDHRPIPSAYLPLGQAAFNAVAQEAAHPVVVLDEDGLD